MSSFKPNPFGLYDTVGNVWEWAQDCWHGNYEGAPVDGSAWLEANNGECNYRVVRGGSWSNSPRGLRLAGRDGIDSGVAFINIGFRVARDL
ncbi:MAG: formylglycine-generating enzyme family protein [Burkholderiales bacterium]|nr:formylglycine-generating enzyme family protein [Burkholderiales bacterium]MCP5292844.1 formylglycine-generating enzyme family protein [Burkholderiales bacterium]